MTVKPDLTRVWASGAPVANVEDPDVTTPGKYEQGWVAEVPTYQNFNYLQRTMTQGLAHINEEGIPIWDSNTEYPVKARVKGSDGNLYTAILAQSGNDPTIDNNVNWKLTRFEESITPEQFGAIGDGVIDDSDSIINCYAFAEVHSLKVVLSPKVAYLVSKTIPVGDNIRSVLEGLIIFTSTITGTIFDFSDSRNSKLSGGVIDASSTSINEALINMINSINCEISGMELLNPTASPEGAIAIGGTATKNRIIGNKINASAASGVSIFGDATQNTISDNKFSNNVGFGVRVTGQSSYNTITGNISDFGGIELVGITFGSSYNTVIGNIALGTNDNGISVSGFKNTVQGNICRNCAKAGIWSWGSENTITGNVCFNNNTSDEGWAGIGVSANYGGTGQNNVITGNLCGNESIGSGHFNSYRLAGMVYNEWQASTSYTKSNQGTYVYYGLNVYIMVTEGTLSSGTTAPVHTVGDVSDGNIVWRYVNSFEDSVESSNNSIVGNVAGKSQDEPYQDVSGSFNPILADKSSTVKYTKKGPMSFGSFDSIVRFIANGVDKIRLTVSNFRPEADLGLELGNQFYRFSSVFSNIYAVGDGTATWRSGNGSPENNITAVVGSMYTRLDGGVGTTLYVKESGTGNTGWVAK